MKSIAFTTTLALVTTALSILVSGLVSSTAAAADYGYVNYRNYDEGSESLAAFRARPNATVGTATPSGFNDRGGDGLSEAAGSRSASQPFARTEQGHDRYCDLQSKPEFNNSSVTNNRTVTHAC